MGSEAPAGYALLLDSGEPRMASFVEELQRRLKVCLVAGSRPRTRPLSLLQPAVALCERPHGPGLCALTHVQITERQTKLAQDKAL